MIDVAPCKAKAGCRRRTLTTPYVTPRLALHSHHIPMRPVYKWNLLLLADWPPEAY